jgi:TolA-binding protein
MTRSLAILPAQRAQRSALLLALLLAAAAGACGCAGEVGPAPRRFLKGAEEAYLRGENERALGDLNIFLKEFSGSRLAGEAYYYRGMSRLALEDRSGARADLTQAAGLLPDRLLAAQAMLSLGELTEEAGDLGAAERLYRQSVEKLDLGQTPADEALFRLGGVLQKQGRWADADLPLDRLIYLFAGAPLAEKARRKVRCTAWTIRDGTTSDRPAALEAAAKLTKAGLPATVREMLEGDASEGRPSARLTFAVEVGRYPTYAQAAAALPAALAKAKDAVITETR